MLDAGCCMLHAGCWMLMLMWMRMWMRMRMRMRQMLLLLMLLLLLLLLMLQMLMPLWAAGDDDDDPLFLQSARQSATDVSITGPAVFTQGPPRQFRTGVNQLSPPLDDPISRPRSPRSAGDPIDLVTIA